MIPRALALLLASAPALAQDRPPRLPARDVDVTYRSGSIEQRWRFRAFDQKLRLDPPTPGVYMILDYAAHQMTMVNDSEQAVLDTPAPATAPFGPGTTRRGTDEVAGLRCTEWETGDSAGLPTLACFTQDGVMLRARRGAAVLVEAAHVSYAPLDAGLFVVPAGYRHHGRAP